MIRWEHFREKESRGVKRNKNANESVIMKVGIYNSVQIINKK